MTRFLSLALGADEPTFSHSIQQLEQAAGRPSADIRLTSELMQALRTKIVRLGLDPADTTGPELYNALQARLKRDERTVLNALHVHGSSSNDILEAVERFLNTYAVPRHCFALKTSVVKRLLKKKPPKNAMKRLGYRSLDSMLKHESVASLYAAAAITEPAAWQKSFREQYDKLSPSDFEARRITMQRLDSKKWQKVASEFVGNEHRNIMSFRELGALVMLPIEAPIDGLAITTILLVCEEMNGIRAYSSYAKLQQVQPNFGERVRASSLSEPNTSATLAGQPVPWRMIQRYYARFTDAYHPELFEPHVQPEDLGWLTGERLLTALDPSLDFWQGSEALGLLHDGQPVSCNALDVALGYCNKLPFHERVVHFARHNLWHELMMRYLHQENLESAVRQQLSAELEGSLAFDEAEAYNTT